MAHPQIGIFALGTLAHTYLEFDGVDGADPDAIVRAVAALDEPTTTMGGVNLVAGFRPEVWRSFAPDRTPARFTGFDAPVVGPDGYTMPATQHDVVLWIAGGSYDIVFDAAIEMINALAPVATLATEVEGWSYHRDRDLTGFEDGTENPPVAEAPAYDAGPRRRTRRRRLGAADPAVGARRRGLDLAPGRGAGAGDGPDQARQHRAGPATGGLARRPHRPGRVRARLPPEHGLRHGQRPRHVFVGFCAEQRPLATMLHAMAGIDGTRDDLTRYSRPLTGAYYFVPSVDDLAAAAGVLAGPDDVGPRRDVVQGLALLAARPPTARRPRRTSSRPGSTSTSTERCDPLRRPATRSSRRQDGSARRPGSRSWTRAAARVGRAGAPAGRRSACPAWRPSSAGRPRSRRS